MNALGAWEVHSFLRLPLHKSQCRTCGDYRNHVVAMDSESSDRVAEDMARLWGSQEIVELRKENKRLLEEREEAQGEIEDLKKQLEIEKSKSKRISFTEASGTLPGVGASEQENICSLPGPTEAKFLSSSSSEIITQSLPGMFCDWFHPTTGGHAN